MIDVRPGTRFKGLVNGAMFEVVKIENGEIAIVRDLKTGREWMYGVEALKRLKAVNGT